MRMGPTIQFCTRDRPRILQLRNTSPRLFVAHFGQGGYIITIRPTAMGIDVVPMGRALDSLADPVAKHIRRPRPIAIARKIHKVRTYRGTTNRLMFRTSPPDAAASGLGRTFSVSF